MEECLYSFSHVIRSQSAHKMQPLLTFLIDGMGVIRWHGCWNSVSVWNQSLYPSTCIHSQSLPHPHQWLFSGVQCAPVLKSNMTFLIFNWRKLLLHQPANSSTVLGLCPGNSWSFFLQAQNAFPNIVSKLKIQYCDNTILQEVKYLTVIDSCWQLTFVGECLGVGGSDFAYH